MLIEEKKIPIYFFSFLIILFPIFLISGPFLTDLVVFLISIYSLFIFLEDKKYFKNLFFIYLLVFSLYITSTSIINLNDTRIFSSLKNSIFYIRFALFSIGVWYLLNKNPKIINKLFYILTSSYIFLMVDSSYQLFYDVNLVEFKIDPSQRVSSLFGEELILGSYLTRLFPILVALRFLVNNKKQNLTSKFINILFILCLCFVVFITGERTALFLYFFSLFLLVILINGYLVEKLFCTLLSVTILLFLTTSNLESKKRIIDLTLNDTNLFSKNKEKFIFSPQYEEHFISSYRIFRDNPLFGVGVKKFRDECKVKKYNISEQTCSTHPHNTYMQLLSETGLVGFIFIFTIFLTVMFIFVKLIFFKFFKKKSILNNFQISLLIGIFISLWPLAPSGNFFNNWLSAIYFFPAGMLLWSLKNSEIIVKKTPNFTRLFT